MPVYRSENQSVGFTECVRLNKITSLKQDRLSIKLKRFKLNEADENDDDDDEEQQSGNKVDIEDEGDCSTIYIENVYLKILFL